MLKIEDDFIHRELRCVVAIGTNNWSNHRVGYVGIKPGHPLHGVSYDDSIPKTPELLAKALSNSFEDIGYITAFCAGSPDDDFFLTPAVLLTCHGGITYSGSGAYPVPSIADLWWFGFDAAHLNDDPDNNGQPFAYMRTRCVQLADQLAGMQP